MFSDHAELSWKSITERYLENPKTFGIHGQKWDPEEKKNPKQLEFKNTLQSNSQSKRKIKKGIRKYYFELNENTTYKNLWDLPKVLREKFIAQNTSI